MKSVNFILAFGLVAALAAVSPPAISFYYGPSGPTATTIAMVDPAQ